MAETITYTYTTKAEIASVFSQLAVTLRIIDETDSTSSQTTYLTDIIEEATDVINEYLLGIYNASDLANSKWVRRRASWIAVYLLSQRRGNPAQFQARYDEIIESLEQIMDGRRQIPRTPTADDFIPVHRNAVVDDRLINEGFGRLFDAGKVWPQGDIP